MSETMIEALVREYREAWDVLQRARAVAANTSRAAMDAMVAMHAAERKARDARAALLAHGQPVATAVPTVIVGDEVAGS